MLLTHYVYGRRPSGGGYAVLARSADAYLPEGQGASFYGSAPTFDEAPRLWSKIYDMRALGEGACFSCFYPLRETETPCAELRASQERLTPAAHVIQFGRSDFETLLTMPAALAYFDEFFPIDDIYHLPANLSEVPFEPYDRGMKLPRSEEIELTSHLAAFMWRALAARGADDRPVRTRERLIVVVPAADMNGEMESMRRLLWLCLKALPLCMRRKLSVTLNADANAAELPPDSAVYFCHVGKGGGEVRHTGVVFDLENGEYPRAEEAVCQYLRARLSGDEMPLNDWLGACGAKDETDLALSARLYQISLRLSADEPEAALEGWTMLCELLIDYPALSALSAQYAQRLVSAWTDARGPVTARHLLCLQKIVTDQKLETPPDGALQSIVNRCDMVSLVDLLCRGGYFDDLPFKPCAFDPVVMRAIEAQTDRNPRLLTDSFLEDIAQRATALDKKGVKEDRFAEFFLRMLTCALRAVQNGAEIVQELARHRMIAENTTFLVPEACGELFLEFAPTSICALLRVQMKAAQRDGRAQTTPLETSLIAALRQTSGGEDLGKAMYEAVTQRVETLKDGAAPWIALFGERMLALHEKNPAYAELTARLLRCPAVLRAADCAAFCARAGGVIYVDAARRLVRNALDAEEYLNFPVAWRAQTHTDMEHVPEKERPLIETALNKAFSVLSLSKWGKICDAFETRDVTESQNPPCAWYDEMLGSAVARRAATLLEEEVAPDTPLALQRRLFQKARERLAGMTELIGSGMEAVGMVELLKERAHMPARQDGWFLNARKQIERFKPDRLELLEADVLADDVVSPEQMLVTSLNRNARIDWQRFFENALKNMGLDETALAQPGKMNKTELLTLISLLIRLNTDGDRETGCAFGALLKTSDVIGDEAEELWQFLRQDAPRLIRRIKRQRLIHSSLFPRRMREQLEKK